MKLWMAILIAGLSLLCGPLSAQTAGAQYNPRPNAATRDESARNLTQASTMGVFGTSGANHDILLVSGFDFDEGSAARFFADTLSAIRFFHSGFVAVRLTNGHRTWQSDPIKTGFSGYKEVSTPGIPQQADRLELGLRAAQAFCKGGKIMVPELLQGNYRNVLFVEGTLESFAGLPASRRGLQDSQNSQSIWAYSSRTLGLILSL